MMTPKITTFNSLEKYVFELRLFMQMQNVPLTFFCPLYFSQKPVVWKKKKKEEKKILYEIWHLLLIIKGQ